MTSALERELYRAAALTFEELGFMLPLPDNGDGTRESPGVEIVASVGFRGPFSGRVMVGAARDFLPALAANMLGEAEVESEVQQLDALAEVANVICGNLLPAIAGTEAVFDFEAPQVFEKVLLDAGDTATAQVDITLDEGAARVSLTVDGGRPQVPAAPGEAREGEPLQ